MVFPTNRCQTQPTSLRLTKHTDQICSHPHTPLCNTPLHMQVKLYIEMDIYFMYICLYLKDMYKFHWCVHVYCSFHLFKYNTFIFIIIIIFILFYFFIFIFTSTSFHHVLVYTCKPTCDTHNFGVEGFGASLWLWELCCLQPCPPGRLSHDKQVSREVPDEERFRAAQQALRVYPVQLAIWQWTNNLLQNNQTNTLMHRTCYSPVACIALWQDPHCWTLRITLAQ